jgi:hypothetical protein
MMSMERSGVRTCTVPSNRIPVTHDCIERRAPMSAAGNARRVPAFHASPRPELRAERQFASRLPVRVRHCALSAPAGVDPAPDPPGQRAVPAVRGDSPALPLRRWNSRRSERVQQSAVRQGQQTPMRDPYPTSKGLRASRRGFQGSTAVVTIDGAEAARDRGRASTRHRPVTGQPHGLLPRGSGS